LPLTQYKSAEVSPPSGPKNNNGSLGDVRGDGSEWIELGLGIDADSRGVDGVSNETSGKTDKTWEEGTMSVVEHDSRGDGLE
jgi:hypothetical protein